MKLKDQKCPSCGGMFVKGRGFQLHMEKMHPAIQNGRVVTPSPSLPRVRDALATLTTGRASLMAELQAERAGLMVKVSEIDSQIATLEAIERAIGGNPVPKVTPEADIPEDAGVCA